MANLPGDDGNLPLHWMFHPHVSIGMVTNFFHAYPNGSHAVNSDGALPLHKACAAGALVGLIRVLLL